MVPLYQWLVLSLALGVQSRTIAPDPMRCFPKSPSLYFSVTPVDEKIFFAPVGDVVDCLTKVKIDKAFALDAVDSFNDILKDGYGYYYYNNDILKSSPIANPFGWEIFNGTSGGQVDYDKEFQALREEIEAKGHADGMLAYKINDILLRAKDGHTSGIRLDMGTLSLFDESPDAVPSWLSLQINKKGALQVVNNVLMNGSVYDVKTNVVRSINGEDPLSYLDKLVSNPAIGSQSQFKSPGVRMNVFLDNFNFETPKQKWVGTYLGDISNLPTGLLLEYDNGSTAYWTFIVLVPENYMYSPPHEIGKMLSQKSSLYDGFKEFKDGKRMTAVRSKNKTRSEKKKRYLIVPDDQLGFEQFKAISPTTKKLETYSGYLMRGDVMVWKLPTFAGSKDAEDLVNFWNAMAARAKDNNIDKLIIDMSNNGGGYVRNVLVSLKLLYPDARTEDVLPPSNTRVTDVMYKIDNAASAALDINNKVHWNYVTGILFNEISGEERIRIISSMCTPMLNFDELTQGTGVQNAGNWDWYSLGSAGNSIIDLCQKDGITWNEADTNKFFEVVFASIVPPKCISPDERIDNCTVEVVESVQSGKSVSVTKSSRYNASEIQILGLIDEYLARGEVIKSPFKSYVLFSNSALVGSGAHMFQTTLMYLSQKYPELQSLTTVSMGCMGNRLQCAMSSFAGQIVEGSPWISEIYGLFALTETVKAILETESLLQGSNITSSDVQSYLQSCVKLRASLPAPPALSSELPQFASRPFFYDGIPPNSTIPIEYFNIPADTYIPFWPAPKTTTFNNQASLGNIYDKLLTMFP